MYKVELRKTNRARRKLRVRKKVAGTAEMPRLSVFRSNRYIYAQIINDATGKTLVDVSSETVKLHKGVSKTDAAKEAGKLLAKKSLEKGVKAAVFDRNGYKYHGRVKSLADAAREGGLKI
jgi:large subunit ribosomal protein L18